MKLYDISDSDYKVLQPVVTAMSLYGITKLSAAFNGGGDSGEINYIDIEPAVWKSEAVQPKVKTDELNPEGKPIMQAFEDLCYEWLENQDVDWYNDEGGFGEILIAVPLEGKAEIESSIYVRVVESECEHSQNYILEEA